jgi:hypothetical protein
MRYYITQDIGPSRMSEVSYDSFRAELLRAGMDRSIVASNVRLMERDALDHVDRGSWLLIDGCMTRFIVGAW